MKNFKKVFLCVLFFTMFFAITSCSSSDDEDTLETAKTRLVVSDDDRNITSNLTLTTECYGGATASYVSSNETYLKVETTEVDGTSITTGVVTRPEYGEENVEVTLTATLTLNKSTATKEFSLLIIAEELALEYTSIADLFAANVNNEASTGDIIELQDMLICDILDETDYDYGYYLTDNTNVIFVLDYSVSTTLAGFAVGDKVTVKGEFAKYSGAPQLKSVTSVVKTGTGTVTLAPTDITAYDLTLLDSSDVYNYKLYRIFGTVGEFTDSDGYTNTAIFTGTSYLELYYRSYGDGLDACDEKIGEYVSIVCYITEGLLTLILAEETFEIADATEPELDDATKLERDIAAVSIVSSTVVDITLPTEGNYGTTISWESSDEDIISEKGEVTLPSTTTEVTLTATFTLGTETAVAKEYKVTVAAITPYDTIAEVFAGATSGSTVIVNNLIVMDIVDGYGCYLTDNTNVLFVYNTSLYASSATIAVGDEVKVSGTFSQYNNSSQLSSASFTVTGTSTVTLEPVELTIDELQALDATNTANYTYYTITGIASIEAGSDGYDDYILTSTTGETIEVYYKSNKTVLGLIEDNEGKSFTISVFAGGNFATVVVGSYVTCDLSIAGESVDLTPSETVTYTTISDLLANATLDDEVILENVEITEIGTSGYYVTDGTDTLYVYKITSIDGLYEVGDVITITATYSEYKDTPQLQDVSNVEAGTPTYTVIADVFTNASKDDIIALNNVIVLDILSGYGYVVTDNENILFVLDYDVDDTLAKVSVGDTIKVTGTYAFYNNAPQLKEASVISIGTATITIEPTEITVDALIALSTSDLTNYGYYKVTGTAALIVSGNNTNAGLVATDGTELTVYYRSDTYAQDVIKENENIEITVTVFAAGNLTTLLAGSSTFEILVDETEYVTSYSSIEDLFDSSALNHNVNLTDVIVLDIISDYGYVVTDNENILFVLDYDVDDTLENIVVGDEVSLAGLYSTYNNAPQLKNTTVVKTGTGTITIEPTEITVDELIALSTSDLTSYGYYKLTGTAALIGSYKNAGFVATDETELTVYYKSDSDAIAAVKAEEGNEITVVIFASGNLTTLLAGSETFELTK